MTTPSLSVIVPAHQCAQMLERTLNALLGSEFPRERWELIVVDDVSTDSTVTVARRHADVLVEIAEGPRGPAFARNRGAERARGDYLVFIDSDVCVHPTTLSRIDTVLSQEHDVAAVFGAYDTAPPAPGLVSQYRNLLHHYVHTIDAGDAETFWAGCGAVRRSAFLAVGMFDEVRFPRPQIEDIELGYRLSDAGHRIVLRPDIQGTHLKRWTFSRMVMTDFHDRAVPWARILLERDAIRRGGSLNTRHGEKVFTLLVGVALMALILAGVTRSGTWLLVALACLAAVVAGNGGLLAWFARERGVWFAIRVVPLRLVFYLLSGAGATWAIMLHIYNQISHPVQPVPDITR